MFGASGGWDALEPRGRRAQPITTIRQQERDLGTLRRNKLSATAQDAIKNFELVGWMVRKHLDYVTKFSFQSRTGIAEVDDKLEEFDERWQNRLNFDAAQRHCRSRFIRMAEARRCIDGDIGLLKISRGLNRGLIQAIEQDRIRTPDKSTNDENWVAGCRLDSVGSVEAYGISTRAKDGSQYADEAIVQSKDMCLHAWWGATHRFDACRGVSPIVAGLNRARDLYEGFNYALAKVKIAQAFGLKITRQMDTEGIGFTASTADVTDGATTQREIDFGAGPVVLDLEAGEDASILESNTPATQTMQFFDTMTMVLIKCLDLPMSFYNEAHTNFYGSRGGLMQYIRSAMAHQDDVRETLVELTRWRVGYAIGTGEIDLNFLQHFDTFDEMMAGTQWISQGVPWWDPAKEVTGHLAAMDGGISNPQLVCRQTGTDFFENIDAIAEARAYAESKGVELQWRKNPAGNTQTTVTDPNTGEDVLDPTTGEPLEVDEDDE